MENNTFNHRNIEFKKIKAGWIFNSSLPDSSLRWMHWCRFFTMEEISILEDNNINVEQHIEIIKKAIDRAYKDMPIYRGDIRDFRRTQYE